MSLDYRYVIERRVAEYVVALPRARARQLMAFFEHLADTRLCCSVRYP